MLGEYFDASAELFVRSRHRPHWSQAGAIVFVTFRTKDSIPHDVIVRWERERQAWVERVLNEGSTLRVNNADAGDVLARTMGDSDRSATRDARHWSRRLSELTERQRLDFRRHFDRCRETKLDECLGACVLRRPEIARIVADALLHFDGDRYRMGDFIVMPNHVHFLAAFATPTRMERQFNSWLHFTATMINRRLNTRGRLWQQEPFDHLVPSPEQYEYLRRYIAENPIKAKLKPGEFLYRRYEG